MVLFEDTAALAGIAIAFVGILLDQLTGSSVFDPSASIAIGVLLVAMAMWMGHDTSELLIGAAARPQERETLIEALEEFDEIEKVVELLTMVLGPNSLMVAARVDFAPGLHDEDIERISERVDRRLHEVVPDVTEVFLDATAAPGGRRVRSERRSVPAAIVALGVPAGVITETQAAAIVAASVLSLAVCAAGAAWLAPRQRSRSSRPPAGRS
jgi:divalent metal cation (Fe/Co/Zn/Cd) transporter